MHVVWLVAPANCIKLAVVFCTLVQEVYSAGVGGGAPPPPTEPRPTHTAMASILGSGVSDEELKKRLLDFDFSPGPITDQTRTTYLRYLEKLSQSVPAKTGGSLSYT